MIAAGGESRRNSNWGAFPPFYGGFVFMWMAFCSTFFLGGGPYFSFGSPFSLFGGLFFSLCGEIFRLVPIYINSCKRPCLIWLLE